MHPKYRCHVRLVCYVFIYVRFVRWCDGHFVVLNASKEVIFDFPINKPKVVMSTVHDASR